MGGNACKANESEDRVRGEADPDHNTHPPRSTQQALDSDLAALSATQPLPPTPPTTPPVDEVEPPVDEVEPPVDEVEPSCSPDQRLEQDLAALSALELAVDGDDGEMTALRIQKGRALSSELSLGQVKMWQRRPPVQMRLKEPLVEIMVQVREQKLVPARQRLQLWLGPKALYESQSLESAQLGEDAMITVESALTPMILEGPQAECNNVLQGHTEVVSAVSVLPDGSLVSCSEDCTIRVWRNGECCRVLEGHSGAVSCMVVTVGGDLVSGSRDCTVRLWTDASTCEQLFEGHTDCIGCVAVHGAVLASGAWDNTVRLWECTAGGSCLRVLEGHVGSLHTVRWAAGGGQLLSAARDATLMVWDAKDGHSTPLRGHTREVECLELVQGGASIVSGSWDATARVWDRQSGECVHVLRGHKGIVYWVVELAGDTKLLATGSKDGTVRLWRNGVTMRLLSGHTGSVRCAAAMPDGRLITGSWDSTIRIWGLDGQCQQLLQGHTEAVGCMLLLASGHLVTGSYDGSVMVWA